MSYKEIKAELSRTCSSVKYFTEDFYRTFLACVEKRKQCVEAGVDDSYMAENGYVRLYHSYDPVYRSAFYNKNSGTYCEFLSLIN